MSEQYYFHNQREKIFVRVESLLLFISGVLTFIGIAYNNFPIGRVCIFAAGLLISLGALIAIAYFVYLIIK